MHEMTAAFGLLKILEDKAREHGIARISRVRLKIGRLRGLEARQLAAAFESLAEGSLAEGASLDIDETAAQARCRGCGTTWTLAGYWFECPTCGAADAEILDGRELFIESFDGERNLSG